MRLFVKPGGQPDFAMTSTGRVPALGLTGLLIAIMMLLSGGVGEVPAQSGAWVSNCSDESVGVVCQGWSVTGGDTLEARFGCTGATGGGVLVCRGREICDIIDAVEVRDSTYECKKAEDPVAAEVEEEPQQAPPDNDPPDDQTAAMSVEELETFAEAAINRMMQANTDEERLEIARRTARSLQKQQIVNGFRQNNSHAFTPAQMNAFDIQMIFAEVADNDCTGARSRLVDNFRSWVRGYNPERVALAAMVFELICGDSPANPNAVAGGPSVSSNAGAAGQCIILDVNDTSANVRNYPNGDIVNRLRNGRSVKVAATLHDNRGRPWYLVEGEHEGQWRRWGYVFGELVDCAGSMQSSASPATPSPGSAQCVLNDPADTAVNVRETPNGKVVNRLRNGRVVSATMSARDSQGRSWYFVESWHDGQHRRWGYVFGELIDCPP